MIVEFNFPYGKLTSYEKVGDEYRTSLKITEDEYRALRVLVPQLPEDWRNTGNGPFVAELSSVAKLVGSVEVLRVFENASLDVVEDMIKRLDRVVDRLSQHTFNERVGVHVPGLGLLLLNEVKLLENGCTDDLQKHLNDGWRIVACCPQPDSRRPDYIMGRSN